MLSANVLSSMNVMFATPCHNSMVTMEYTVSMYDLLKHSEKVGLRSSLHILSGSLVTQSRNRLVAQFLSNPNYTHLFWIDSDISFKPEAVFRLLQSGHQVAVGVYPLKRFNWPKDGFPSGLTLEQIEGRFGSYPFNVLQDDNGNSQSVVDDEGFVEIAEAPCGFMVISRDVFLRMIDFYPSLQYRDDQADSDKSDFYWLFFDCMLEASTRRYLTEDFAFCHRWRQMGGKIQADATSQLSHAGQYVFRGDFQQFLLAETQNDQL